MTINNAGVIPCSNCPRQFRWNAKFAGRRLKCKCGTTIRIPERDPGALATDMEATVRLAPGAATTPAPAQAAKPGRNAEPPLTEGRPAANAPSPAANKQTPVTAPAMEPAALPVLDYAEPQDLAPPAVEITIGPQPTRPSSEPAPAVSADLSADQQDSATYDIDEKPLPPPAPLPNLPMPTAAAANSRAGTAAAATPIATEEKEEEEKEAKKDEDPHANWAFWEIYLPAGVALLGVVGTAAMWRCHFPFSVGDWLKATSLVLAIQVLVFIPLSLLAAITVAKWMELSLGPAIPVVLKLAAITLGPAALADAMFFGLLQYEFDTNFILVAIVLYMFFCGGPTMLIFRTDPMETGLMTSLQALPRILVMLAVAVYLPKYFSTQSFN